MKHESNSNKHPEKAATPLPILECWSDDQIVDLLGSGELSIKPLPGLETSGMGWVNCPVTLGQYMAQETYRTKALKSIMEYEESIDRATWDLVVAIEDGLMIDPPVPSDQRTDLDDEETEPVILDPRKFSCVVGFDLSNPDEHELLQLLITFKGLERTGMSFNAVAFMDTFVDYKGRPIYVQRQFNMKCGAMPPQNWFWEDLIALVQLRESSMEGYASWAPVHVMAMADIMNDLARHGHDAEFYMNYLGPIKLPFQQIISREPDYQLHADKHIGDTLASLRERHGGLWHTDVYTGEEFGEEA